MSAVRERFCRFCPATPKTAKFYSRSGNCCASCFCRWTLRNAAERRARKRGLPFVVPRHRARQCPACGFDLTALIAAPALTAAPVVAVARAEPVAVPEVLDAVTISRTIQPLVSPKRRGGQISAERQRPRRPEVPIVLRAAPPKSLYPQCATCWRPVDDGRARCALCIAQDPVPLTPGAGLDEDSPL